MAKSFKLHFTVFVLELLVAKTFKLVFHEQIYLCQTNIYANNTFNELNTFPNTRITVMVQELERRFVTYFDL